MRGADIQIDQGVPLPTWTRGDVRDLLARMQPGDSVLVDERRRNLILTEGRKRGCVLKSQKQQGTGVRVWLIQKNKTNG